MAGFAMFGCFRCAFAFKATIETVGMKSWELFQLEGLGPVPLESRFISFYHPPSSEFPTGPSGVCFPLLKRPGSLTTSHRLRPSGSSGPVRHGSGSSVRRTERHRGLLGRGHELLRQGHEASGTDAFEKGRPLGGRRPNTAVWRTLAPRPFWLGPVRDLRERGSCGLGRCEGLMGVR